MKMEHITKEQAAESIKKMFKLKAKVRILKGKSFFSEKDGVTSFFFNKMQYEREEVINRLSNFFKDKVITGGQCRIEPLTILYTIVHIEDRPQRSENWE